MRPLWQGAMFDGTNGYATDGHCCLRWPDQSEPTKERKIPDFNSVYDKPTDTETVISLPEYEYWKKKLPLVPDFTECEYCNGEGQVTWEFEHFSKEDVCPHCKGYGGFENKNLMVPDPNKHFAIAGLNFTQKQFDKIIHVMKTWGREKTVLLTNSENPYAAAFAKIGNYEILIMPYINQG